MKSFEKKRESLKLWRLARYLYLEFRRSFLYYKTLPIWVNLNDPDRNKWYDKAKQLNLYMQYNG